MHNHQTQKDKRAKWMIQSVKIDLRLHYSFFRFTKRLGDIFILIFNIQYKAKYGWHKGKKNITPARGFLQAKF